MTRKTAFVTGASRGIGKAVAIWLAKSGYDVAVTARTVEPGEQREHSPTAKASDTSPLPGSLSETRAAIEALGREVLMLPADITDPASVAAAATIVLERWGAPDVLVNCARHTGPGHMDTVETTPLNSLRAIFEGNFFTPLLLCQIIGPKMAERGSGAIVNFTSMSAFSDPLSPAGEGGWGAAYGCSKAAIHRLTGILQTELGARGVRIFNIDPGNTWTERIAQDMAKFGFGAEGRVPLDVCGAAVAWLVTQAAAAQYSGKTVFTPALCADLGLVEGWDRSKIQPPRARLDLSASALLEGKAVSD